MVLGGDLIVEEVHRSQHPRTHTRLNPTTQHTSKINNNIHPPAATNSYDLLSCGLIIFRHRRGRQRQTIISFFLSLFAYLALSAATTSTSTSTSNRCSRAHTIPWLTETGPSRVKIQISQTSQQQTSNTGGLLILTCWPYSPEPR